MQRSPEGKKKPKVKSKIESLFEKREALYKKMTTAIEVGMNYGIIEQIQAKIAEVTFELEDAMMEQQRNDEEKRKKDRGDDDGSLIIGED